MRAFAIILMFACAVPVLAQEARGVPRVLIDRQLRERAVLLTGVDERTVTYTDSAGLSRTESVDEFVALVPPAGAAKSFTAAATMSALELTDGQRFFGDLAPAGAARDSVRWSHPTLGTLEFKLDQVRHLRFNLSAPGGRTAPSPPTAQDPNADLVIFANGDRATGFVESVSGEPRVVKLGPIDQGPTREIGLEVVREIVLSNPAQLPAPRATVVWLRDGSVLTCRGIRTSRLGELTLTPAFADTEAGETPPGTLVLDDLLGVAFDSAAVAALSAVPPASQTPTGGRPWTRPVSIVGAERAVLGAGDIQFPGPVRVEWVLPAGTSRLTMEVELPREMWTWGRCTVVVLGVDGGGNENELARVALDAERPRGAIGASLTGSARLVVRVDPGEFGAVQNGVVLRRPLLLIERK
jgi:hypothetical protein